MKWKSRLTNYNFWVSMVSAVLLVLQAFDLKFDIAHLNEIVTAILGLLVVIGIINDPTKNANLKTSNLADVNQQKDTTNEKIVDEQNGVDSNDFTPNHNDEAETIDENDCQTVRPQIENESLEPANALTPCDSESALTNENENIIEQSFDEVADN